MNIEYNKTKVFTAAELQGLFLSVKWEPGNYPEKLVRALEMMGKRLLLCVLGGKGVFQIERMVGC